MLRRTRAARRREVKNPSVFDILRSIQVGRMEPEVVNSEMLLPPVFPFKKVQMGDKYPKGHARGRHWKHLKQILQAENYQSYHEDEPNCNYISVFIFPNPFLLVSFLFPFLSGLSLGFSSSESWMQIRAGAILLGFSEDLNLFLFKKLLLLF